MQGRHGLRWSRAIPARVLSCDLRFFEILLVVLLSVALSYAGSACAVTKPAGDLAPLGNPDGELDVRDFLILQRFILGTLTPTPEQRLIADVASLGSPDGELNAGDLVVLMRAIQGLVSLPPVYLGPDAPVLNASSGTTYDNPYTLTGTAEAGREVRLYLNGTFYATTTSTGAQGGFEFQFILGDGENQLYAVVVDAGEEGPTSDLLTLDYVNNIPREQGGTLTGNSVWTPGTTPTPYVITSTLTVAPGATWTLMPGTVLRFASGASLDVAGTLNVTGTPTSPVLFTSDAPTPALGNWVGLLIRSSTQNTRIDGAIIEYATNGITVDGAQTQISNCTVRAFGASWSNYGIGFINGAGGIVEDCVIDNALAGANNNLSSGIYTASGAQPEIRQNTITNTGTGVLVEASAPWLHGNTLANNSTGIHLLGGTQALINGGNVITGNSSVGIQYDGLNGWDIPGAIVKNNTIFNNRFNIYISGLLDADAFEIDVTENWWGSTSPSVISSGIWDHKDVWGEGAPPARVVPFLNGPDGQPVAGNFLNGRLAADATLETSSGPYTVVGSCVVAPETKLTIPSAVRVEFASNTVLHVRGGLQVLGEPDAPVVFISSGDIGSLPKGWGVLIGDLSSAGWIAAASITEARFENLFDAIETGNGSQTDISRGRFTNNDSAIRYDRGSYGSVANNTIEGLLPSGGEGIVVRRGSYPLIAGNSITGLAYGIDATGANPLVQGNVIQRNIYGIRAGQGMEINAGNTITENDYGIHSTVSGVAANNNNIYSNGYNYYKTGSSTNDATNNWWGTSVESEVAAGIYSQTPGAVVYVPFLTGPVPVAPVIDQGISITNASDYSVTGMAQPGVQIRIYVNGTATAVIGTVQDGTFSGTVTLSEGENNLYAEAFNVTTTSSPSNTLVVTLDTQPPVITLTAPVSGSHINVYPVFTGALSEPATLTVAGEPATVTAGSDFSHGPVSLNEGVNTTLLQATDAAGNIGTRSVTLTLDTTPPTDPDMQRITFGSLSGDAVTVQGGAGAVEAGAQVHVANARTGEVVMVVAGTDGAFSVSIAAAPGDTLTLVVTDDLGNQTVWSQNVVSGTPASLSLSGLSPANGSVINGTQATITGEFQGPEGTGIVVGGIAAQLHGNRFIAGGVQLSSGANAIDITATAPDGATYTQTLNLTSTGTVPFSVSITPETGVPPLIGVLTVVNDSGLPMQSLQIDLDDDGTYEATYTDLDYAEVSVGVVYYEPGVHRGRVHVVDGTGADYSLPFGVMVEEAIGKQARLRALYQHMLDRLAIGNVTGALGYFESQTRAEYAEIFSALESELPAFAGQLRNVEGVLFGADLAEFAVTVDEAGIEQTYLIYMHRSSDGVWRISDM